MGATRARIAIDAMGGDHAPDEIVAGALRAQAELDADVLLVGDPDRLEASIKTILIPSLLKSSLLKG